MTIKEYARKQGKTRQWINSLLKQGRIPGAKMQHIPPRYHGWVIPQDAQIIPVKMGRPKK